MRTDPRQQPRHPSEIALIELGLRARRHDVGKSGITYTVVRALRPAIVDRRQCAYRERYG